jgi:hypothetical protein
MHDRSRAYEVLSLRTGGSGAWLPHVRVFCTNCTGRLEFPMVNSRPPEAIAKAIRAKGWEFVLENARYTLCPECIGLREAKRKGESPGPKQHPVQLFGQTVDLPEKIVPPDLVPPPSPTREPRVFKEERPAPPPQPSRGRPMQRYRIEMATAHDLADLVVALKALGDTTMISLVTEETPAAHPVDTPYSPKAKSPEHIKKIRQSAEQRSKAYTERVRNALLEIRKEKSNGRPPSVTEYVRGLNKRGVEPFRPGRPWSVSIVQKHLDAMDSR